MRGGGRPQQRGKHRKLGAGVSIEKFARARVSSYDPKAAREKERALNAKVVNKYKKLKQRLQGQAPPATLRHPAEEVGGAGRRGGGAQAGRGLGGCVCGCFCLVQSTLQLLAGAAPGSESSAQLPCAGAGPTRAQFAEGPKCILDLGPPAGGGRGGERCRAASLAPTAAAAAAAAARWRSSSGCGHRSPAAASHSSSSSSSGSSGRGRGAAAGRRGAGGSGRSAAWRWRRARQPAGATTGERGAGQEVAQAALAAAAPGGGGGGRKGEQRGAAAGWQPACCSALWSGAVALRPWPALACLQQGLCVVLRRCLQGSSSSTSCPAAPQFACIPT